MNKNKNVIHVCSLWFLQSSLPWARSGGARKERGRGRRKICTETKSTGISCLSEIRKRRSSCWGKPNARVQNWNICMYINLLLLFQTYPIFQTCIASLDTENLRDAILLVCSKQPCFILDSLHTIQDENHDNPFSYCL